jgi:hypothetical protein
LDGRFNLIVFDHAKRNQDYPIRILNKGDRRLFREKKNEANGFYADEDYSTYSGAGERREYRKPLLLVMALPTHKPLYRLPFQGMGIYTS